MRESAWDAHILCGWNLDQEVMGAADLLRELNEWPGIQAEEEQEAIGENVCEPPKKRIPVAKVHESRLILIHEACHYIYGG
jgi:hypothetical protein